METQLRGSHPNNYPNSVSRALYGKVWENTPSDVWMDILNGYEEPPFLAQVGNHFIHGGKKEPICMNMCLLHNQSALALLTDC